MAPIPDGTLMMLSVTEIELVLLEILSSIFNT